MGCEKPHNFQIRVFKNRKLPTHKCKCFVCSQEGHYVRDCKKKTGDLVRAALMDGLDLLEDWDVVSVDLNKPDIKGICSASEGEARTMK